MQILIRQDMVPGDQRNAFQNISEFPNISRPGITLQRSQCGRTKFQAAGPEVGGQLAEDMGAQNGYVFDSLAQRWNGKRNPADAIVQIASKLLANYRLRHDLLGGCHQTNVNSSITNFSEPAKLLLFHDLQ